MSQGEGSLRDEKDVELRRMRKKNDLGEVAITLAPSSKWFIYIYIYNTGAIF